VLIEQVRALVDQLAKVLELVGAGIILVAIILATVTFLRRGSRTSDWRSGYPHYRSDIGRGILLGLELLVGADIISTITAPLTFESVGLLAYLRRSRSRLFSVAGARQLTLRARRFQWSHVRIPLSYPRIHSLGELLHASSVSSWCQYRPPISGGAVNLSSLIALRLPR
jgi:uncharacterized membrane protein